MTQQVVLFDKTQWKACKLGDVACSNKKSVDKNYPFAYISYLDTGSITKNRIDGFQEFKVSEAPSRAKRLVNHHDIIYSTVRPIQRHFGFIENPIENLVVSTGFSVIEVNKKLAYPKYIYYLLSLDENVEMLDIIAEASTSTYPSLKPSDIENLDLLLPPLSEQKEIAEILSSLDDKIDLLHRQNKTLESMAQTLFRQWFIEEAREEWETGTLEDIIEFNPVRKLKQGEIATYLPMDSLQTDKSFVTEWYLRAVASGSKFQNGDTLLARITPSLENGKTAYVDFLNDNEVAWGSTIGIYAS